MYQRDYFILQLLLNTESWLHGVVVGLDNVSLLLVQQWVDGVHLMEANWSRLSVEGDILLCLMNTVESGQWVITNMAN
jgi:hypothetical protein